MSSLVGWPERSSSSNPGALDAPDAIGLPGTLYLYRDRDRVRIVAGRFQSEHERKFQPGEGSILPEHRAERVAAVSGKRARRYLQRQHLLDLGTAALAYLTELTHRRPRGWIHDVEQLHALLQSHGDAALRTALERGLAEHAIGAESITHYLGTPIPSLPFDDDRPSTLSASALPRAGRVQAAAGALEHLAIPGGRVVSVRHAHVTVGERLAMMQYWPARGCWNRNESHRWRPSAR